MTIPRLKLKIFLVALLPVFLLLKEYLFLHSAITEKYYSRMIYIPIGKLLSRITGILPISIAEILSITVALLIIGLITRFIYGLFATKHKLHHMAKGLINVLCTLSVAYCLFLLLWGFNYYREPLAASLGYQVEENTVADLKGLCSHLIDQANQLRGQIRENETGIMELAAYEQSVISSSAKGYHALSQVYPFLGGTYGKPKGIFLSRQFSYTGIAGIYIPFTGEANFNKLVPDPLLASTVCHEMAHQRGFAREDEANFIAYLTCKAHPDLDFQYSGYLLAAIHSMNALYKYGPDAHRELAAKYSDAVRRDLKYISDFWKQFEGPVEELQEKMNDAYLKSNKQLDGVHSYGRMVDLLLAEFKTNR